MSLVDPTCQYCTPITDGHAWDCPTRYRDWRLLKVALPPSAPWAKPLPDDPVESLLSSHRIVVEAEWREHVVQLAENAIRLRGMLGTP